MKRKGQTVITHDDCGFEMSNRNHLLQVNNKNTVVIDQSKTDLLIWKVAPLIDDKINDRFTLDPKRLYFRSLVQSNNFDFSIFASEH